MSREFKIRIFWKCFFFFEFFFEILPTFKCVMLGHSSVEHRYTLLHFQTFKMNFKTLTNFFSNSENINLSSRAAIQKQIYYNFNNLSFFNISTVKKHSYVYFQLTFYLGIHLKKCTGCKKWIGGPLFYHFTYSLW